jgi:uncharacterized protein DUF2630
MPWPQVTVSDGLCCPGTLERGPGPLEHHSRASKLPDPDTLEPMKDEDVIRQIDELVAEERQLHERATGGEALTAEERSRERDIDIHLDVLWDLMRQRRALRGAGKNPDDAVLRGPSTVEGYRQ